MIKIVDQTFTGEANPTLPKCPHCSADVRELHMTEIKATFGRRYLYYCSECQAVLGVSHRKGFWMG